jgi:hypothetical protein
MEPNRIWHDPSVQLCFEGIPPGVSYSAEAYDMPNRRWYRLEIAKITAQSEVPESGWVSSTVANHISTSYAVHKIPPWWNTIIMTSRDSAATFRNRTDDQVSSRGNQCPELTYGTAPTDKLPTTSIEDLEQITFASPSTDRCIWRGQDCAFKRIEFGFDIEGFAEEIRAHETLINVIGPLPEGRDLNSEILRRFCVVPILAVVIRNRAPWPPGTVTGLLMPYLG